MMRGYVNRNYEGMISLVIKNSNNIKYIQTVIDTGFTGFLSLPYYRLQIDNIEGGLVTIEHL